MLKNRIFYTIKPLVPRRMQIFARRQIALNKRYNHSHIWPIDPVSARPPAGWPGWPNDKKFAFLLCHDVDTKKGHDNCQELAEIELNLGFRSCFNFVPERYQNSNSLQKDLQKQGFGIGVHGLKHDGKLFSSHKTFIKRAPKINYYLKVWKADGFTSPSMHHNLEWLHALDISYSTATFDTDPFEPQPDAAGTIFPMWVQNDRNQAGYFELPYTLPQDHLLFVILRERNIDIWKKKLDWIAEKGGMALLNTHSDYMAFDGQKAGFEEYPAEYFVEFLEYVKQNYSGEYYHCLPREVARFCRNNLHECFKL